jgi:hypothetical protein
MLRTDNGAWFFSFFEFLKEKNRGNLTKDWNLFELYSFEKLETIKTAINIGLGLLENEELILLLLIHNQILSTDNSEPFFTLRESHTNNLVGFSAN